MKILSIPLIKEFNIEADEDKVAAVRVRQTTEGENIERNQMFARTTRVIEEAATGDVVKFEQDYNVRALRRKEAYLALAGITGVVIRNENGEDVELFRSADGPDGSRIKNAMTEEVFNRAWGRLDAESVREIISYVHEVNPDWSPRGE